MMGNNSLGIRVANIILIALALITVAGCQQKVSPKSYVSYCRDSKNGLIKQKNIGDVTVKVDYMPLDLIAINELKRNNITEQEINDIKSTYGNAQYYHMQIKMSDNPEVNITNTHVNTELDLEKRLNYLSFQMQRDIALVESGDTLKPIMFNFERSYDVSEFRSFMVAFETPQKPSAADKTFILDTPVLRTGPIKFTFSQKDISSLPPLKFN